MVAPTLSRLFGSPADDVVPSMLNWLKSTVEAHPRLNDALKLWRAPQTDLERWLDRFSTERAPVRFLQIGANDGLHWDPYRNYIVRDRWQGLLVEPLPNVFLRLCQNYAYIAKQGLDCINVAISDTDGVLDIWTLEDSFLAQWPTRDRVGLQAFASLDPEQVIRNVPARFGDVRPHLCQVRVRTMTVASLMAQYWQLPWLDLLTVDCEGHDETILCSIDFTQITPSAIIYECHNLTEPSRERVARHLTEHGYTVTQMRGDCVAERTRW